MGFFLFLGASRAEQRNATQRTPYPPTDWLHVVEGSWLASMPDTGRRRALGSWPVGGGCGVHESAHATYYVQRVPALA